MTDTVSPITEPHLTPMFATGSQPALASNTEPHPSPIFDTGPHPEPLQPADQAIVVESEPDPAAAAIIVEWDSGEWELAASEASEGSEASEAAPVADAAEAEPASEAEPEPVSTLDYEREPVWDAGSPESEPELARIARNLDAADDPASELDVLSATADSEQPQPKAFSESDSVDTDAFLRAVTGHLQQPVAMTTAQSIVVPSAYQFLKRWKFALIVAGVWLVAAAAGAGFYYWWYTALDKTMPVFGILLYMTVCMVASVLVSMVPNRTHLTGLSIALMSAPLASTAAASVLHGAYFFEWITRPMVG